MIVTTTNTVEGHSIREYCGIVFGEVITGVNIFRDIGASFRDFFGGRSQGYEDELQNARNEALAEMCHRAENIGANAVVGVDVDYEVIGTKQRHAHGQRLRHCRSLRLSRKIPAALVCRGYFLLFPVDGTPLRREAEAYSRGDTACGGGQSAGKGAEHSVLRDGFADALGQSVPKARQRHACPRLRPSRPGDRTARARRVLPRR